MQMWKNDTTFDNRIVAKQEVGLLAAARLPLSGGVARPLTNPLPVTRPCLNTLLS